VPVPLSRGVAWLKTEVHTDLLEQADRHAPYETGGLLLGYRHSPIEIVITDVIGPGPHADHRRTGFTPDADWQAAELARRYASADRRITYLGDWHTHPGGGADLSRTDRRTLRAIGRHPDARCPQPIMAVLAGGEPWTLCIRQPARRAAPRRALQTLAIQIYW